MRVVLDSNVIVAAFATRGICSALFEYCVENDEVVICEEMLKEIEVALVRKVGVPRVVARDVSDYIRGHVEIVRSIEIGADVCRDKTDLAVLGAALGAGCEYIVTGDADLLVVEKCRGVEIVSPRSYWEKTRRGTK